MGTHDPSICVSTTLSDFVVAKDEGDMVENVCCPMLTELVPLFYKSVKVISQNQKLSHTSGSKLL